MGLIIAGVENPPPGGKQGYELAVFREWPNDISQQSTLLKA